MMWHRFARPAGALLILSLLVGVTGCDSPGGDVDFGGDDMGPDRYSVLSEDGEVKMGLTDAVVYFALSDSLQAEVRSEVERETDKEGLGGMIGGIVSGAVGKAIGFRAKYPVEDIRDIRWADGEMVVEFEDGSDRVHRFEVDDRPVTEAFREEDVRSFAEEFHRAKRDAGGA